MKTTMTSSLQNTYAGNRGETVARVLLVGYWLSVAIFGFSGLKTEPSYSMSWVMAELLGLLLSVMVSARYKILRDYISAPGLAYCGWILYVNTFYIVYLFFDVSRFINISGETINKAFYVCLTSTAIFGAIFETCRHTSRSGDGLFNVPDALRHGSQHDFSWLSVFVIALCSIYYVFNLFNSGASGLIGYADRLTLANTIETGKIWLINYIMTGFTLCIVYRLSKPESRLGRKFLIIALFAAIFWAIYVLTGNRRGLISVFIASYAVLLWRNKLNARLIIIGAGFLILAALFAQFRQTGTFSVNDGDVLVFIFNVFGEFMYPQVTLLYAVEDASPLLWGSSFFTWLWGILGSYVGFQPHHFMSQEFAMRLAPAGATEYMGFAFMPLTEAYLNFGEIGSVLAPLLLATTILVIQRIFGARSMAALVLMSLALDMNRGEFGATIVQFSIFYFAAVLLQASTYFTLDHQSIQRKNRQKQC
jgi:oligosaccharide repeat unit polymerase